MFSKSRQDRDTEVAQCPVCRCILGKRNKTELFKAHCVTCNATFWWKPGTNKPTVVMDKDIQKEQRYCSRDGCICRD